MTSTSLMSSPSSHRFLKVDFADPFVLMHELKAMGEQHAPSERTRHKFTPLSTFAAAAAVYQSMCEPSSNFF